MSVNNKKKSLWGMFSITDPASCKSAIYNGGIAAMLSAGITIAIAVIGFFSNSHDKIVEYVLDPDMVLSVVLVIVLGIFIFRKSRIAATIMVLHFALSKALIWYDIGNAPGFLSIIFFLFYFNAMRGTYIWHKLYKNVQLESVA
jgi:hypothetical protein